MSETYRTHATAQPATALLKWAAGFVAVLIVQVSALPYIAIEVRPNISVQPDLLLIMLFFFGLRFSHESTIVAGFASGLCYDLIGSGLPGLTALAKTVSGFLVGFAPPRHKIQKTTQFLVLFLIITLMHDLIVNAVFIINTEIDYWKLVLIHSLPSTVYTLFIGVIVYYWLEK